MLDPNDANRGPGLYDDSFMDEAFQGSLIFKIPTVAITKKFYD